MFNTPYARSLISHALVGNRLNNPYELFCFNPKHLIKALKTMNIGPAVAKHARPSDAQPVLIFR